MILVNFCHSQQTQQILSTAEHSENFKKPILTTFIIQHTMCDTQFHCCEKMAKEKEKNTSPRTAPAMSCSRLKIHNNKTFFCKVCFRNTSRVAQIKKLIKVYN